MLSRRASRAAAASVTAMALALPLVGASSASVPGAFWDSHDSSLSVLVSESPGGVATPVTVTGPDDFRTTVGGTSVLRQLAPGTYTVTAPEVKSALGTLTSDPSSVTISLGRNDHQAVSIPYQLHPAALNPRGNAADFAIQSPSAAGPARWNPCQTITWGPVLPLPAAEEQLLTQAFAKASLASGVPFARVTPGTAPQVSVNLTFVPGDRVSGEGDMLFRSEGDGPSIAYSGQISGNIGTETSAELREALYLHEIGHVLGITHVASTDEVMHEVVDESDAAGFAAGDTAGLQKVGAAAGCLDRPLGAKEVRGTLKGDTLEINWFQPASVPPVTRTELRLTTNNPLGSISAEPSWNSGFTGAGAGPMKASAKVIASQVCSSQVTVTLASRNSVGTTETPVNISGCPTR